MYIADLHIHSRYSRATSRDCTPEYLDLWARRKGIQIVGTGDFTHPAWREELREKLEPAEDGLYVLKEGYRIQDSTAAAAMQPRFVVTGEISSIYKKKDKVRKVHSLILLPGLEDAEIISGKLESIGTSIPTDVQYWDYTAGTCWKSCWSCVHVPSMCRPISGHLIFLYLGRFPVSIQWRNALMTYHHTSVPWRQDFPRIPL